MLLRKIFPRSKVGERRLLHPQVAPKTLSPVGPPNPPPKPMLWPFYVVPSTLIVSSFITDPKVVLPFALVATGLSCWWSYMADIEQYHKKMDEYELECRTWYIDNRGCKNPEGCPYANKNPSKSLECNNTTS